MYFWLEKNWSHLVSLWQQKKLPHALLFSGASGLGKFNFAKEFAVFLLCQSKEKDKLQSACGICNSCQLFKCNNHPDFFILEPEESAIIKVEQVRVLIDALNQTANYGGHKIAIIAPAESMNIAASNALLKTLEEPENKVVLILVANQESQLLPTIRSRCQRLIFNLPETEAAVAWLTKQPEFAKRDEILNEKRRLGQEQAVGWVKSERQRARTQHSSSDPTIALECEPKSQQCRNPKCDMDIEKLLLIAAGSPLKALELMADADLEKLQLFITDLISLAEKKISLLEVTDKWSDLSVSLILTTLFGLASDLIKIRTASVPTTPEAPLTKLAAIMHNAPLDGLFVFQEQLVKMQKTYNLGIKLNPELSLENLLISWGKLFGAL